MKKTVFVVAGEASADLHAAKLVEAMKRIDPEVHFWGIGGPKMAEQGVEIMYHASELGLVGGLHELWSSLKVVRAALKGVRERLRRDGASVALLLDYPDFNLRLARDIHDFGIPIVYYISPQVWAWRAGRVKMIKELVRKMLVIFPFEVSIYRDAGVDVECVGHPLLEEIDRETRGIDTNALRAEWKCTASSKCVALMPGSRRSEVLHHLDLFLESASEVHAILPDVRFVLPIAPTLDRALFEEKITASKLPIILTTENATRVLAASDAAIIASGTSTLQAALLQTPMVIVYRVASLSYFVFDHFFRRLSFLGLPNIILQKDVVPELIQDRFQPKKVAAEVVRLLTDRESCIKTKQELGTIRALLGDEHLSASARAAMAVFKVLNELRDGEQRQMEMPC